MIVLGIDPGIERMGYAILDDTQIISSGLISTEKNMSNHERFYNIFSDLISLINNFKPELIVTETLFFSKNIKTASTISEVRGIIKLIAAIFKLQYLELSPLQIKMALTGYGKADKKQIEKSVQMILKLKELPTPDDVIDAMAIAICGINKHKFNLKLNGEKQYEKKQ